MRQRRADHLPRLVLTQAAVSGTIVNLSLVEKLIYDRAFSIVLGRVLPDGCRCVCLYEAFAKTLLIVRGGACR